MTVQLHKESNKINIKRGVRQGDTISPKLFTAALESILRQLTWETRGLKIGGEYRSHLRFVDDMLICTNIQHELQQMLQELVDESKNKGPEMNKSKTSVIMKNDTPIYVNNTDIENVESFVCLGQRYNTKKQLRQRDSNKNHGRMDSIRQTPRGNMGTHQPSKEQASSRTKLERSTLNITY